MIKEVIASGKTVVEAQENARALLGAGPLDDVTFQIVHAGSKGIFGIIGVKPAQVKASMEVADEVSAPRHERRSRPQRTETPREERPVEASAETAEAPKPSKKKKKKKSKPAPQKKAPEVESTSAPECEMKMERLEVGEGEDLSYELVKTLIQDLGLDATAELYLCEDGTRRITIVGEDASALIGHHGDTLDALQYLANLASAQKNVKGERIKSRVTIDIEGYRAKREATLRALARRMAAKALRNKRSVMLEPMSAYERRIIHSEIQGIEGVSTNSIGSDNNRKIVIYLTEKRPNEIFEEDERRRTPLAEEFAPDEDATTLGEDVEVSTCTCENAGACACNEDLTVSRVEAIEEEIDVAEDDATATEEVDETEADA